MKTKRHQLWRKVETTEGTLNAPTVAEAAYAAEVDEQPDYQEFDQSRVANSLDKEATLVGQKRWKFPYALDFKGGGASGGVPQLPEWDPDLRMCGFRVKQCYYVTGTAITGSIQHGATFSQATSLATGRVIGSYSSTPTRFHFEPLTGTVDANHLVTVTNPDSTTATFTTDNPSAGLTAHGFVYRPATDQWSIANRGAWTGTPTAGEIVIGATSGAVGVLLDPIAPLGSSGQVAIDVLLGTFTTETITGASSAATCSLTGSLAQTHNCSGTMYRLIDGKLIAITGARGDWSLPLKTGEPIQIKFSMQGFEYLVTTSLLGAASYASASRATQRFVSASWSLDGYSFHVSKCEISGGNKLEIEPDPTSAEGAISYRIADRDPQVSLDPSDLPPAAYSFLAKAAASTLVAAKIRMGTTEALLHSASTAGAGSILWIDLPNIQYGPPKRGDRDGTVTAEITGRLRRGSAAGDDSIAIFCL